MRVNLGVIATVTIMLKYIELKSGYSDSGPAWIANINLSKSGSTIYFNGKALKSIGGSGVQGNYQDLVTGEEFWVSGVRKNGSNRHPSGSGRINVEESALPELLELLGVSELDTTKFTMCGNFPPTYGNQFYQSENEKL